MASNAGPGLLDGISVVECGQGISASFAARLMADLGADVIKVETPHGDNARVRGPFPGDRSDPEKSGLFIYLNANKRGIKSIYRRKKAARCCLDCCAARTC